MLHRLFSSFGELALIVVASPVVEHGLDGMQASVVAALELPGSRAQAK